MNKEQIELAVSSGLTLLGSESEVVIPVKLNDGVFLLKQLLTGIATGQIGLGAPSNPDEPKPENPTPNGPKKTRKKVTRRVRNAPKKASRKKK